MNPSLRRSLLLLVVGLMIVSVAPAADLSWLAFLPKADRAKAVSLVETMDALRASIAEDRSRSIAEERKYAQTARVLAAALDRHASSPASLAFELEAAGYPKTAASRESAVAQLVEARRLRWESASEIAGGKFGRPSAKGFRTAAAREREAAEAGKSLSAILALRLKGVAAAAFLKATKALEDRIAASRTCPPRAFATLREAARGLDTAVARAWFLALAEGTPDSIASSAPLKVSATANPGFSAALESFSLEIASRASLLDALPAAAGASWYVDLAAARASGLPEGSSFAPPDPSALSSLAAFLRGVAESDAAALARYREEDAEFDAAFSEALSLCWVAWTRSGELFSADTGLGGQVARIALEKAWTASETGAAETLKGLMAAPRGDSAVDWEGMIRAERFAVRAEAALSEEALLADFVSLNADGAAISAIRFGRRHAVLRERLGGAYRNAIVSSLDAVRTAVGSGFSAVLLRSVGEGAEIEFRFSFADGEDGGAKEDPSALDPFSTLLVAARLRTAATDGSTLEAPLAPNLLAKAFPDHGRFPAVVATLPFLCSNDSPSGAELALLEASAAFSMNGDGSDAEARARSASALARLIGRRSALAGLPPGLSAASRDSRFFAAFLSSAERLVRVSRVTGVRE